MKLKNIYEWIMANKELVLVALIFAVLFLATIFFSKLER